MHIYSSSAGIKIIYAGLAKILGRPNVTSTYKFFAVLQSIHKPIYVRKLARSTNYADGKAAQRALPSVMHCNVAKQSGSNQDVTLRGLVNRHPEYFQSRLQISMYRINGVYNYRKIKVTATMQVTHQLAAGGTVTQLNP